ncbi:hypothetical protein FOZ63_025545 [Perkinsus olseni]|uniref:Sphingosine kinase 2 n=1 Tax=Perkinsus olseni TaxID=32597 RepID=A0A7J6R1R4_PEROL|nr:hypothetical protein FOZ63_025545 [Perkinsus olseni]
MRATIIVTVGLALTVYTTNAGRPWKAARSFLKSIRGKNGKAGKEKKNGDEDPDRYANRDTGEKVSTLPGAHPVDEAGREPAEKKEVAPTSPEPAVPRTTVVNFCSLAYTCPLGSSDDKQDLGGVEAHVKGLAPEEDLSLVEYALDYLYFWDSSRHNDTLTSVNVLLDLDDIIPHEPPMDDKDPCSERILRWGYGWLMGIRGTTDVGNEKVTVTLRGNFLLPSGKSCRKLRIHEVEVLGSRVWKKVDIKGKHVDMLHEIEKRTPGVKEGLSADMCEEQLFEYGKEIGRLKAGNHDAPFAGVLGSGAERKTQLQAAVALIYHALMNDM